MSLFGPPNVEQLKAKRDVHGLARALSFRPQPSVRAAAAVALRELKNVDAVEPLVAALKDPDADVRLQVVSALGQFTGNRVVGSLVQMLIDSAPTVREAATQAIWRQHEFGTEWLVDALGDRNPLIRQKAAELLGQSTRVLVIGKVVRALNSGDANVCAAATDALCHIGVPAVEPLLDDIRLHMVNLEKAMAVLSKLGPPAVDRISAQLVETRDNAKRETAASVLEQMGCHLGKDQASARYWAWKRRWDKCAEIGQPAAEILIAELRSTIYVKEVVAALGEIGDPRAVEPLLAHIGIPDHRASVIGALAKIGAPAVEPLIQQFTRGNKARPEVAAALGRIRDPRAVEPLVAALADQDIRLRVAAASALDEIGDPRAVQPLVGALGDAAPDVRTAACNALDRLGWKPETDQDRIWDWIAKKQWDDCIQQGTLAIEPLITALKGAPAPDAANIAAALGAIRDARAIQPLVAALERSEPNVPQAAADALAQIGWEPTRDVNGARYWAVQREWEKCAILGEPAAEPLTTALRKPDTRAAARKALRKIGAPAVQSLLAVLDKTLDCERMCLHYPSMLSDAEMAEIIALLGAIRDTRAVSTLGRMSQDDKHPVARAAAIAALGTIGDPNALAALIAALDHATGQDICKAMEDALVKIGPLAVEPLVVRLATSWQSRAANYITIRTAVSALERIYRAGKLDEKQKQLILSMRTSEQKRDSGLSSRPSSSSHHSDDEPSYRSSSSPETCEN